MFRRVLAIALNTYRESVRARILIGLTGVAFATAFYSLVVGAYTLKYAARVVSNFGTASLSLFSFAVTVLIGATSLHRELEQKTIFPILARPIRRTEYLVGKYLGTVLTVATFVMADAGLLLFLSAGLAGQSLLVSGAAFGFLALAFLFAAIRFPKARTYGPIVFAAALLVVGIFLAGPASEERRVIVASASLTVFEVGLVTALVMFFSSFSTPFVSALYTLGLFIVGRNADLLPRLPIKQFGEVLHNVGVFLSKVVPNLQIYVPPRPLLTGEAIDANLGIYFVHASVHGLAWSFGLLAAASFLFKRRDFL